MERRKRRAIRAALLTGCADTLISDGTTARMIIEQQINAEVYETGRCKDEY